MKNTVLKPTLLVVMMFMALSACAHPTPKDNDNATATVEEICPADTIEVMSQAMGRTIKNVVIKPEYYVTYNQNARYPVVYLLHGAYGCYSDWSKKADLHRLANEYAPCSRYTTGYRAF